MTRIIRTICLDKETDELMMSIPSGDRSAIISMVIKKIFDERKLDITKSSKDPKTTNDIKRYITESIRNNFNCIE